MLKIIADFFQPKKLIVTLTILLIPVNVFYLLVSIMIKVQKNMEYFEPGYQFIEFRNYLKGVKRIGYITNKDMSPEKNSGDFLQAQYILAPVVLDLNNSDHEYIIVDSDNIGYIVMVIKGLNSKRLVHNEYGQALIKRLGR